MLLLGTSKDDARAGLQLAFVADGVSEDGASGGSTIYLNLTTRPSSIACLEHVGTATGLFDLAADAPGRCAKAAIFRSLPVAGVVAPALGWENL